MILRAVLLRISTPSTRLLGIATSLFLVSCNNNAQMVELENQLESIKERADSLEKESVLQGDKNNAISVEIAKLKSSGSNLAELKKQELEATKTHASVIKYYDDLNISNEFLDERLSVWRKASRDSMTERELGTLRLTNGEILRKTILKAVTDTEVSLSHSGGEGAFSFDLLPLDLREELVHEPTILSKQQIEGGEQ